MFLRSVVLWVSDLITSSFRFLVFIKIVHLPTNREILKGNFENANLNSI